MKLKCNSKSQGKHLQIYLRFLKPSTEFEGLQKFLDDIFQLNFLSYFGPGVHYGTSM